MKYAFKIIFVIFFLFNVYSVNGIELNQSDCGGIIQDRMEWHFEDGHIEYSPWNTYVDITSEYDNYITSLESIIITPINSENIEIKFLSYSNRKPEDKVFCNSFTKNAYFFVNILEQSYVSYDSDIEQKRYNICFDSYPYLCTYNDGRLQPNQPRYVKYISGYGYGINKSKDEQKLLFTKGLIIKNNISEYPFNKYESEITFFLPSKIQIIKKVQICGNEKLKLINSSINFINPNIFDRKKGFNSLELINLNNINRTWTLNKIDNCFEYTSPSNSEGKQINGYWLYSINSVYEPNKTNFENYLKSFYLCIIIVMLLPFFMYLLNKFYQIFNYKEIYLNLVSLFSSGSLLLFLWEKLELYQNMSPINFSKGDIIIYGTFCLLIVSMVLMLFVTHWMIKYNTKKLDLKCLDCNHTWKRKKKSNCPYCKGKNISNLKSSDIIK